MYRTNDGQSLDDYHDKTESNGPSIGESLEIIALELTLTRLALERWYDAEYSSPHA